MHVVTKRLPPGCHDDSGATTKKSIYDEG